MSLKPFHLAVPVTDLGEARRFYGSLLGCPEGRSSDEWVDFDFFGHQLVAHLDAHTERREPVHNAVDGKDVPVPHFGVVLEWKVWQDLADRLTTRKTQFVIEPGIRFEGKVGEQATMFLLDPSGNALEFKAFKDMSQLFAS
jgi:extradiol dioxygenase family protein